jgi:hypothetical protein
MRQISGHPANALKHAGMHNCTVMNNVACNTHDIAPFVRPRPLPAQSCEACSASSPHPQMQEIGDDRAARHLTGRSRVANHTGYHCIVVFSDAARASLIVRSDSQGSWWSCTIAQEHNRAQHMSALASTRYTGQGDKLLQGGAALVVFLVQLHSTGKHGPEKVHRAALLNSKHEKRTIAADLRRDKKYFESSFIGSAAVTRHMNSWRIDICTQTLSFASWGATAGNRVVLFTLDLGIQNEGMD